GRRGLEPLPVGPVQRQRRLARPRRPGPQPPPLDRTPRPRRPRARRRQDPPVPLPQPPRPRHTLRPTRNTSPSAELALEDTVLRRAGSPPSRPGRRLTPPAPTQRPRHGEALPRNSPRPPSPAPSRRSRPRTAEPQRPPRPSHRSTTFQTLRVPSHITWRWIQAEVLGRGRPPFPPPALRQPQRIGPDRLQGRGGGRPRRPRGSDRELRISGQAGIEG